MIDLPHDCAKLSKILVSFIETFISAHVSEHSKVLKDPNLQKRIAIDDFYRLVDSIVEELKKAIGAPITR